jgi:hypothetical protein
VPCQYLLWIIMLVAIGFYRIDRGQHEEHLRVLAER